MGTVNLQTKIILYTIGVIATLIVTLTGMNLWIDASVAREHLKTHTSDLARGIAPIVKSDLENRRLQELENTIRNFSYNDAILWIDILDSDKSIVTGTGVEPRPSVPLGQENLAQTPDVHVFEKNDQLFALAPVSGETGETVGYVRVYATAHGDHLALQGRLITNLVFAGLLGIIGSAVGYLAGKRLTRPLKHLTHAAEDLASGREPESVESKSHDELGNLANSFNKMVEKRREAELSMERSQQHLLFILKETPLGYIEWGLNFEVINWNKASENIFGYTSEEAVGKNGLDLIVKPEFSESVKEVWQKILEGRGENENLGETVHADGTTVVCQWNNTVIRGADGEAMAVASLINDVTESIKTQETMRMAMVEAQKATKAKSEFLANMSHEIRTPMNGVIGLTELLLESELDTQQRSYLEVIRSSGEMLITIINDILDLAKIESGKFDLNERVFDIKHCLGSAFDLFRHNLDSKGLEHHVHLEDSLPEMVNGDPIRLQQVIYNLVNNAVKFTEKGSIRLHAWAEQVTSLRTRLFVSIQDTGPGIDKELIDTIFEPFSQADTSSTRSHGGTGLGLTICRRICKVMRGDIQIDRSGPEGTQFTFYVELNSAPGGKIPASKLKARKRESTPVEKSNLRILIVEDNSVNRLVTKRILSRLGYDSVAVEDGQKAVDFVSSNPCDLILMDLQMPVMDGLTATKAIREAENDNQPAIVALTASAIEGDRERCMNAGMDDYISKPINMDSVKAVMERLALKV